MNLELSPQDAKLLRNHLTRHLEEVEKELVRTDKHELQHALATEVERLRAIVDRLDAQQTR